MRLYDVTFEQQVEARICEQFVALGVNEAGGFLELFAGVALEYVRAVEPFIGEITQLLVEAVYAARCQLTGKLEFKLEVQKPCRYELPARRLLSGELHRRLYQSGERLMAVHARLHKAGELSEEGGERVFVFCKVTLYAQQGLLQLRGLHSLNQTAAGGAQSRRRFCL